MREIVLDTETTGISPAKGHRLIEIGCVEWETHVPPGRVNHGYRTQNPDVEKGAFKVNGQLQAFLSAKPLLSDLRAGFLDFICEPP